MNADIMYDFVVTHKKDLPQAKFKIGESVNYEHEYQNGHGEILAVADTGDGIEYAIDGMRYLLWESEIK